MYILDTHALLWTLFDPDQLSSKVKKIVSDSQLDVRVSAISFWEISLKFSLNKLILDGICPTDLPGSVKDSSLSILDLEVGHLASFHQLPRREHKDPFDRMLIWQAIQNKATLISKDNKFPLYAEYGLKLIW